MAFNTAHHFSYLHTGDHGQRLRHADLLEDQLLEDVVVRKAVRANRADATLFALLLLFFLLDGVAAAHVHHRWFRLAPLHRCCSRHFYVYAYGFVRDSGGRAR